MILARNQTLHLVFPDDFYTQSLRDLIIVLVGTTTRRHNADVAGSCAIVSVVGDKIAHEVNACVYPVCLKLEEVESAAEGVVAMFAGEVDKFCKRASNLGARRR